MQVPYIQINLKGLLSLKLAWLCKYNFHVNNILHFPRTWQKITGHRCSSWSSGKNPIWDLMAMIWSKWQDGIFLQGWVLCIVQMILFTRTIFWRALVATILTHDFGKAYGQSLCFNWIVVALANQFYFIKGIYWCTFPPTTFMVQQLMSIEDEYQRRGRKVWWSWWYCYFYLEFVNKCVEDTLLRNQRYKVFIEKWCIVLLY